MLPRPGGWRRHSVRSKKPDHRRHWQLCHSYGLSPADSGLLGVHHRCWSLPFAACVFSYGYQDTQDRHSAFHAVRDKHSYHGTKRVQSARVRIGPERISDYSRVVLVRVRRRTDDDRHGRMSALVHKWQQPDHENIGGSGDATLFQVRNPQEYSWMIKRHLLSRARSKFVEGYFVCKEFWITR